MEPNNKEINEEKKLKEFRGWLEDKKIFPRNFSELKKSFNFYFVIGAFIDKF